MRDDKPFNHLLKYPDEFILFSANVMKQIMSQYTDLQNVEAMGELYKYLLRAWHNGLEANCDIIPHDSSTSTKKEEDGNEF